MLSFSIAFQRFQVIRGRDAQIFNIDRRVKREQFNERAFRDLRRKDVTALRSNNFAIRIHLNDLITSYLYTNSIRNIISLKILQTMPVSGPMPFPPSLHYTPPNQVGTSRAGRLRKLQFRLCYLWRRRLSLVCS